MDIITERDHEDLKVIIKAKFVIPYEGSSDWLNSLEEFINKQRI